ncbi:MAG: hypothetical protein BGO54_11440 [Sphingobacteriales bacterium 46-32]|nr:MAG: hypothetical protein BGO54_11440 [Sphingobacteriales bacterium 46-32]
MLKSSVFGVKAHEKSRDKPDFYCLLIFFNKYLIIIFVCSLFEIKNYIRLFIIFLLTFFPGACE